MRSLKAGFTLVEILIVMVVLGILMTLAVGSFQSSQQKSRDARRKSDLKQVGLALEAYYNDYGSYPLQASGNRIAGCGAGGAAACNWGDTFTDDNNTSYMVELPVDPRNYNYHYYSDGTYYQLYARLENNLDASIPTDSSSNPQKYSGVSCGTLNCNYGISSANATPEDGRTLVDDL